MPRLAFSASCLQLRISNKLINYGWLLTVTGGQARQDEFAEQALRQYLLGNTIVLENLELFHAGIGR